MKSNPDFPWITLLFSSSLSLPFEYTALSVERLLQLELTACYLVIRSQSIPPPSPASIFTFFLGNIDEQLAKLCGGTFEGSANGRLSVEEGTVLMLEKMYKYCR